MHVCKEILIQFMGRIISLWALFKFVQNYIYMYHWNSLSAQLHLKRSNSISCKFIIKIYILCIFIGDSYLILFERAYILISKHFFEAGLARVHEFRKQRNSLYIFYNSERPNVTHMCQLLLLDYVYPINTNIRLYLH